ncbi:uncharacterized protein LOC143277569 [Babylonia areolata]|uniref:uncharacterized protein LOC143277569 n=1 Tax=Babylonia areolata TaxID=304850 RepID=UPI003FD66771
MSINFSANQYDQAYDTKRMLSWELPKEKGKTAGIPLGHVRNNIKDPTSRSHDAHIKLQSKALQNEDALAGRLKKSLAMSPLPQRITFENQEDQLKDKFIQDFYQPANPAMKPPVARTSELQALRRHLTPPVMPMNHEVRYPPLETLQLVEDPRRMIPRPPSNDPNDVPPEEFLVCSPPPGEPSTMTGAVDSLQENYIEPEEGLQPQNNTEAVDTFEVENVTTEEA